jgi:hypothetical protein
MTTNIEKLKAIHSAHVAAGAEALVPFMASAINTEDEGIAVAALEYVEKHASPETTALAAVAKQLDANKTPPVLWYCVDVANVIRDPSMSTPLDQMFQLGSTITAQWQYRRETPAAMVGRPLAARILFPENSPSDAHVAAAGRALQRDLARWMRDTREQSRAALLAAAVEHGARK